MNVLPQMVAIFEGMDIASMLLDRAIQRCLKLPIEKPLLDYLSAEERQSYDKALTDVCTQMQ